MNRGNVVRLALAAALFGVPIPRVALAQIPTQWWTPNQQAQRFQDHFVDNLFEGHWVAQEDHDEYVPGARRGNMLPDILHIDQRRRRILVADRRHDLLQVISVDGGFHTMRDRATVLHGDLSRNGRRLVATGRDARGRLTRQVMLLRDGGNILIVRTQVERRSGRMMEVEKVYERI